MKAGDSVPDIKFCFREGDTRPESGTSVSYTHLTLPTIMPV